ATMAEKEGEDPNSAKSVVRLVLWGIMGLFVAVMVVVLIAWACLHASDPRFVLTDVTIYDFNIAQPNLFTSNLQVTLSCSNPNHNVGILYDRLDIYATYRNQEVTLRKLLPASYQGHMDVTLWSPVLTASAQPVDPDLSQELIEDQKSGLLLLDIKIDGCLRFKYGSWVSGCYRLLVSCPAYITFSGAGLLETKYQPNQKCSVDL
ncbi:unnamed protein product, partial [Thlaspi arvense]